MTPMPQRPAPRSFRAIWISDVHLGARGSQTAMLLDFLRETESTMLYLVGDIVDGWRLKRWWYWPQPHNDVIQKILKKARKGAHVVYIPGNHDAFARRYVGYHCGDIEVLRETADGRKLLVMHGDEFDAVVRYARWMAYLGDSAYHFALRLNIMVNWARKLIGLPYWSLSAYLKQRVKQAVSFIGAFEQAVVQAAKSRGVDGVVCGHIHHAEMRMIDGVLYCNDGDWMETCSALVEHHDGRLEILHWADVVQARSPRAERAPRRRQLEHAS